MRFFGLEIEKTNLSTNDYTIQGTFTMMGILGTLSFALNNLVLKSPEDGLIGISICATAAVLNKVYTSTKK